MKIKLKQKIDGLGNVGDILIVDHKRRSQWAIRKKNGGIFFLPFTYAEELTEGPQ